MLGTSLGIRNGKFILFSVAFSVSGLMSVFNRSSTILRGVDVCHRSDSKLYACGVWDNHTQMTIQ